MDALNAFFSTPAIRAIWTDEAVIAAMVRFEAELAAAQRDCNVIPAEAAAVIIDTCSTFTIAPARLASDARVAGTLAIPLVKALKSAVSGRDERAAAYVHYGSTSQDIADTATVLLARQSLGLLLDELVRLGDALAGQVEAHRRTPLLGRTLIQPAAPVTFGWKAAGWLDAAGRCAVALRRAADEACTLQFGGANGTLAAHYGEGQRVARELARRLGLAVPAISWQGGRDRLARLGGELAILCGALGKIGRDISLLMQVEVAEAFEPAGEGRGGSSAMPHKRNPVSSMYLLDAAYRAPALAGILAGELPSEHERGLGSWPNSQPVLADLFSLAASSIAAAVDIAEGVRVDAQAMQDNIDRLYGVVYSEGISLKLSALLGPAAAQRIVGQVCEQAIAQRTPVAGLLKKIPEVAAVLDADDIDVLAGPQPQIAACQPMCSAVLYQWQEQKTLIKED
ncbi:3-carboxy-cis,cis-muconate cycloisomerase [Pigmentiphaga humi]|uniref:3-carboxy-cis,cis-muconate cycloisomerase n=1 Tax=Pigmentiphaga humi TaxID=2478468 RepID=A0A3P4B036_9BURK|nr:adenylosuccinate lyase family protein [Pigmentiphaga humi]VCU68465.1 3-carboxy-cis,cis-muconate cycloisomerase [Pigmentiphaga humi]